MTYIRNHYVPPDPAKFQDGDVVIYTPADGAVSCTATVIAAAPAHNSTIVIKPAWPEHVYWVVRQDLCEPAIDAINDYLMWDK